MAEVLGVSRFHSALLTGITRNSAAPARRALSPLSAFRSGSRSLDSQPAGDVSHKPGGRLPLLSARLAVTLATFKRAANNFVAW